MKLYYVFLTLVLTTSLQIQPAARNIRDLRDQKQSDQRIEQQNTQNKMGSYITYLEKRALGWELYRIFKECHNTLGTNHHKTIVARINYEQFLKDHRPLWDQWQEYDMNRSNMALFNTPEITITPGTPRDRSSSDTPATQPASPITYID